MTAFHEFQGPISLIGGQPTVFQTASYALRAQGRPCLLAAHCRLFFIHSDLCRILFSTIKICATRRKHAASEKVDMHKSVKSIHPVLKQAVFSTRAERQTHSELTTFTASTSRRRLSSKRRDNLRLACANDT